MNAGISGIYSGLNQKRLVVALLIATGSFSLAANGQSPSPGAATASAPASLLPRKVIVPISVVNRLFPEVTREASTGQNSTAVGNPKATRSVIYANNDGSTKVTISVDQYPTASDASSAYQQAVTKSKAVPGSKAVPAENLGPNAFVGTVTQKGETHIGLGALHGALIVGVTLAGYDPTPDKIAKLISLTREEESAAKATLDPNPKK